MNLVFIFVVKLIDQILRTRYLIDLKNEKKTSATIIVGLQQIINIYITVTIVNDFSFGNIFVLVSSTMLGTLLTMGKNKTSNAKY